MQHAVAFKLLLLTYDGRTKPSSLANAIVRSQFPETATPRATALIST
jgi:hypothetical protein